MQKLLADLGVNVILVTTLAKHCSYIYNLDSYCFKIGTLNSPRGGKKFSRGPPKRNPADEQLVYISLHPSYSETLQVANDIRITVFVLLTQREGI